MSQNSSVVQSKTPGVVLEGLRPGTGYVVQVRARTVAGYGAYSKDMLFQTLTDGKGFFSFLFFLFVSGPERVGGRSVCDGEERECRNLRG